MPAKALEEIKAGIKAAPHAVRSGTEVRNPGAGAGVIAGGNQGDTDGCEVSEFLMYPSANAPASPHLGFPEKNTASPR
jgi:hypothetical protein